MILQIPCLRKTDRRRITAAVRFGSCRLFLGFSPQEGYDLCSGASGIRRECGCGGSGSNAFIHSPAYCIIVIRRIRHIGKHHISTLNFGRTGAAPQERADLGSGAGGIGTEGSCSSAGSNSFRNGPQHSVIVAGAFVFHMFYVVFQSVSGRREGYCSMTQRSSWSSLWNSNSFPLDSTIPCQDAFSVDVTITVN